MGVALTAILALAPTPLQSADVPLGPGFEPMIAVNPTDPQNVAMGRLSNARVSTDGGMTWSAPTAALVPPSYVPWPYPDPDMPPGIDASVTFDDQGRLFWLYLAYRPSGFDLFVCELDPQSGVIVAGPFKITNDSQFSIYNDKPWLVADADPQSPFAGRLYLVWTREQPDYPFADIRSSYSTNHGQTWSTPVVHSVPEGDVHLPHVAVAPNGDVYVAYEALAFVGCNSTGLSGRVYVTRSTDGGVTFPQKTQAFTAANADVTFNLQNCTGTIPGALFLHFFSGMKWVLPDPLVPGAVYVVAADDPDNNFNSGDASNINIVRSTDDGLTWSAPQEVSDGPPDTFQLFPTAGIDPITGCIAVAWYDNRSGRTNGSGDYLLDFRYSLSTNGGVTFSPSVALNDTPFDPDDGVHFVYLPGPPPTKWIGEYFGIAMHGGDLYAVWTGNGPNPGDLQETIFDRVTAACKPPCEGDANGDGTVDPLDAGYVLARLGCPVGTGDRECDAADVNADGVVDPLDDGYVLARFGDCV